jgi:hypothetical protein
VYIEALAMSIHSSNAKSIIVIIISLLNFMLSLAYGFEGVESYRRMSHDKQASRIDDPGYADKEKCKHENHTQGNGHFARFRGNRK